MYMYPSTESIFHPVLFTFDVFDLEIKLVDHGQPSSLPNVQIWLVKQIPQPNLITHKNKPSSKKIVHPHLQCMYKDSTKPSLASICAYHNSLSRSTICSTRACINNFLSFSKIASHSFVHSNFLSLFCSDVMG